MPATVIIRPDDTHIYAFPAAHITRVWTSGDTVSIALADGLPHHKLRFTDDTARHLVRGLGQAVVYYERDPQMFIIDIDEDGEMRVTAAAQPSLEKESAGS